MSMVKNSTPLAIPYSDILMPLANKWEELFIFINHYIPGHSIDALNKLEYTRFFRVLRQAEIMHSQKVASMK